MFTGTYIKLYYNIIHTVNHIIVIYQEQHMQDSKNGVLKGYIYSVYGLERSTMLAQLKLETKFTND